MTGVTDYQGCNGPDSDAEIKMLIEQCASQVMAETIHENVKDLITHTIWVDDAMKIVKHQFSSGAEVKHHNF